MKHLSSSQLDLMLLIWDMNETVTRRSIQKKLPPEKWQPTTINTMLNKLVKDEFLTVHQEGREYVYTTAVSKDVYMKYEGRGLLKTLYDNSVKSFVASVCDASNLSEDDISHLYELLEKLKEEN
mgnify:CR=1 FL=1